MTHSKRRITVAIIAAAAALTGANAFAKDGSPTLGKENARSASVFTAAGDSSNDQAPTKARYGKR